MRTVRSELAAVLRDFTDRHWQIEKVFEKRYIEIEPKLRLDGLVLKREMRLLIGAYFCHEYSYAAAAVMNPSVVRRSEEHTSELQSLMRISYAVFCLKKTKR